MKLKSKHIFLATSVISLLTIGCNKTDKSVPINNGVLADKDFYIKEALTKGDTSAYYNLRVYYMDYSIDGILYPALIMANKYGYHSAYADVYYALTCHDHKKDVSELEDLDETTRILALEYLKKGAEKKDKECQLILGRHYLQGKYIKKDIVKGNQLIKEGER